MNFKLKQPRKIISWQYSFLITLPHSWLKHHEIGKGDFLDFEVDEDMNLIVKPARKNND